MTNKSQAFDVCLGEIPCFRHFVRVQLPADVDCTTLIEYYSVLLNHLSKKIGYPCTTKNQSYRYIFLAQGLPNFLTRDRVTLNNTLSKSNTPQPLAAGPIRNAENMEYLLCMPNVCIFKTHVAPDCATSIHYKPFLKAAIRGEQFLASGIVGSPLNSINFCKTSKWPELQLSQIGVFPFLFFVST